MKAPRKADAGPGTRAVLRTPAQRCPMEEDGGEGCVTVLESTSVEALCRGSGGEGLAGVRHHVLQQPSRSSPYARLLFRASSSKKKRRGGKKAPRKSDPWVRDESGLS